MRIVGSFLLATTLAFVAFVGVGWLGGGLQTLIAPTSKTLLFFDDVSFYMAVGALAIGLVACVGALPTLVWLRGRDERRLWCYVVSGLLLGLVPAVLPALYFQWNATAIIWVIALATHAALAGALATTSFWYLAVRRNRRF